MVTTFEFYLACRQSSLKLNMVAAMLDQSVAEETRMSGRYACKAHRSTSRIAIQTIRHSPFTLFAGHPTAVSCPTKSMEKSR
jgi:hypothetical protein